MVDVNAERHSQRRAHPGRNERARQLKHVRREALDERPHAADRDRRVIARVVRHSRRAVAHDSAALGDARLLVAGPRRDDDHFVPQLAGAGEHLVEVRADAPAALRVELGKI